MLVWLAVLAVAQEPEAAGADEGPMYMAHDAPSVRFVGEAFAGPSFDAGEQVTVLLREGDKVRVFTEERFGWVDPDALTTEAPAPTSPPLTLPPGGASSLLGELPPLLQNPPGSPAPDGPLAPAPPTPAAPAPAAPAPAPPGTP